MGTTVITAIADLVCLNLSKFVQRPFFKKKGNSLLFNIIFVKHISSQKELLKTK